MDPKVAITRPSCSMSVSPATKGHSPVCEQARHQVLFLLSIIMLLTNASCATVLSLTYVTSMLYQQLACPGLWSSLHTVWTFTCSATPFWAQCTQAEPGAHPTAQQGYSLQTRCPQLGRRPGLRTAAQVHDTTELLQHDCTGAGHPHCWVGHAQSPQA